MQIRVANRQDEPDIRTIVNEAKAEHGEPEVNLSGADSDLNNVEAHYFWLDGVFLVAEEEGTIVGLIGARRGNSEETLELLRLAVSAAWRGKGVERLLVDHVLFFARNLGYSAVDVDVVTNHLDVTSPLAPFAKDPARPDRWVATLKHFPS